jgi:hypothetical protein
VQPIRHLEAEPLGNGGCLRALRALRVVRAVLVLRALNACA